MPLANLNGTAIYYEETGKGYPVIFLSGLGQALSTWRAQVRLLSREFRVVTYDTRGQGDSDKPEFPQAYSLGCHVDDLLGLMDRLGIARAHLVGLSHGGIVAQAAALRAPERVAGLVLGATAAYTTPLLRRIFLSWIRAVELGGNLLRFDVALPWIFSERFLEANGPLIETLRGLSEKIPALPLTHLLRASLEYDLKSRAREISAPTLILCGELDLLTPCTHARFLHEQIHGSELIVLPGSGHVLPLEAPEAFNAAVGSFLKRVSRSHPEN